MKRQNPSTSSHALNDQGNAAIGALAAMVVFGVVAAPLIAIALLSSVVGAAGAGSTRAAIASPSATAIADIPPAMLASYINASRSCEGLRWTVLAAIGKLDSDHARMNATVVGPIGRVSPEIIGPALDGSNGTTLVADTDNGALDHDTTYDHTVGPMSLLPSVWRAIGVDANGDGVADPQNVRDAIATTVRQICPTGNLDDFRAAIALHDPAEAYVAGAVDWAQRYTAITTQPTIAGYAFPLPRAAIANRESLNRPHHNYPAIDIGVPAGTPTYAITNGHVIAAIADDGRCGGTIIFNGDDGATYTYCHLTKITTTTGAHVEAGTVIGASGGQPGQTGAGDSTGPHLHLGIRVNGIDVCPQPLLLALYDATTISVDQVPTAGCVTT